MFQFTGFPSIRYGLAYGYMRFAHVGFPIQISPDQWIFAPFRYLRINGYLLLPEAFRSLSRLSSALSAKASTLRSFMHNQREGLPRERDSFHTCIALHALVQVNFFTLFSSKCCNCYNSFLFITITSDVLIFSSISYMRFSRYIADDPDISFSSNGEYEIRTRDLLLARQALSQLS